MTTDFLSELPISENGFDVVLVIVDKLSKRAIFEAVKKPFGAREVAQVFQDRLFAKHGVPITIVSDRDPKFISNYWTGLTELLNIRLNKSTSDHPQTDGQSENLIRTLCNILRSSIQKVPTNWDQALSVFEFEYNSSKHGSTGLSPFEVDIGRIPHNPFTRSLSECKVKCQSSFDAVERRKAYSRIARDNLALARAKQKFYADQHRREVSFAAGDWVMLRSDVIDGSRRTDLPKKWQAKYLGPFEVKEVRGPVNYMIEMPPDMKRKHNVFHVSKLKPYNRPSNEVGGVTPSVVIDAGGNKEQIVHRILDKKRENRRVFYLVQFYGDAEEDSIWMHKSELKNCIDLVKDFEKHSRQ